MTDTLAPSDITSALKQYVPEGHNPRLYVKMVKDLVLGKTKDGKDRPDEDLMLFLYVAHRTGLDPLTRQIYAVYRWNSRMGKDIMTIQAGIDGLRTVAQRTGEYCGSDDATFEEKDGKPTKATVTVFKLNKITGERMPVTASARWKEYLQVDLKGQLIGLWEKMPYNQLAKCAEALALRKAFPNELSSIYSEEEMNQSSNVVLPPPEKKEAAIKPSVDVTSLRNEIK